MQFKKYKIKLTPISPIHIGTGDFYLPINYAINKIEVYKGKYKYYLYAFDEILFFKSLPEKDKLEFSKLLNDASTLGLLKTQKFVKEKTIIARKIAYKKIVVSESVANDYYEKIGNFVQIEDKTINQMMIEKTYTSPNLNKAIIPGSSLKGAILTALGKDPVKEEKGIDFLRISDSKTENSSTFIDKAQNIKREYNKNGVSKLMEAISAKSVFETTFDLADKLMIDDIIKACNKHYLPIFKSQFSYETDKNTRANLKPIFIENYENFTPNENQFLVRIGKHSGNRAVTIDSTNKETTDNKNEETTTWIINKQPFGWLLCEILN
ncbi:RAMP superfamily CRISPR-associated protein [Campylobacter gastrosuis]|uniref:RAMP superfamily CRISPR-associated protein n=1 Tax=Campylobacter gastrosuis TaxID=2974576 RepID=A0ABT7HS26_9BACT|nr:RAMP superfamily CRISPR-associated protein [Campylobacter gastrosuis]MDL0089655.1 RAMP superfamily CRISPR-associated protein [Campylobacter gastrosuis]